LHDTHNQRSKDLQEQFTILKKCSGKLKCLIYEMPFLKDRKPFTDHSDMKGYSK